MYSRVFINSNRSLRVYSFEVIWTRCLTCPEFVTLQKELLQKFINILSAASLVSIEAHPSNKLPTKLPNAHRF